MPVESANRDVSGQLEIYSRTRQVRIAARECIRAFRSQIIHKSLFDDEVIAAVSLLKDEYGRFKIWCTNVGVREHGSAALDSRLQDAEDIRTMILDLIDQLTAQVDGLPFSSFTLKDYVTLPTVVSRIKPAPQSADEKSMSSISSDIGLLFRVARAIRTAASSNREARAAKDFSTKYAKYNPELESFRDLFAKDLVERRCPSATANIQRRLIDGMYLRRRRILHLSLRQKDISVPQHLHTSSGIGEVSENVTDTLDTIESTAGIGERPTAGVPVPLLALSKIVSSPSGVTAFNANDIREAFSQSRVSKHSTGLTKDGEYRLDYPPIPEASEYDTPSCRYCFTMLTADEVRDVTMWHEHVKSDLRPYICLFDSCDEAAVSFRRSDEWLQHMRSKHQLRWRCAARSHPPAMFDTEAQFQNHITEAHLRYGAVEKGLSETSLAALTARSVVRSEELFSHCPLCQESVSGIPPFLPKSGPVDRLRAVTEDTSSRFHGPTNIASVGRSRLEKHIASHLVWLALRSLPWTDDDNDQDEFSVSHDSTVTGQTISAECSSSPVPVFTDVPSNGRGQLTESPESTPVPPSTDMTSRWSEVRELKQKVEGLMEDPTLDSLVNRIHGSLEDPIPGSLEVRLARRWLDICHKEHKSCGAPQISGFVVPALLIDVGPLDQTVPPRLVDGTRTRSKYASLTYQWGDTAAPVVRNKDIESYRRALPMTKFPKTFQDAVQIVRVLGFRYLWIEALCIAVDDATTDFETETVEISNIYRCASLSLVAVASLNLGGGCIQAREPQKRRRFPINAFRTPGPIDERAWTMQELVFVRRQLFFCKDGVYWECGELHASDVNPRGVATVPERWQKHTANHFAPVLRKGLMSTELGADAIADLYVSWSQMIENYSARRLNYPSDRLVAVQGLAAAMVKATSDTYVAGLWQSRLATELMWHVHPGPRFDEKITGATTRTHIAPSWSWASCNLPILWHKIGSVQPLAEILSVDLERRGPGIMAGHLRLRGAMHLVSAISGYLGTSRGQLVDQNDEFDTSECYYADDPHYDTQEVWCLALAQDANPAVESSHVSAEAEKTLSVGACNIYCLVLRYERAKVLSKSQQEWEHGMQCQRVGFAIWSKQCWDNIVARDQLAQPEKRWGAAMVEVNIT